MKRLHTATVASKRWQECNENTCARACVRVHLRSFGQPPAVLQQETYCRQHSCNNKAGPVLEGAVLHDSLSRPATAAAMLHRGYRFGF